MHLQNLLQWLVGHHHNSWMDQITMLWERYEQEKLNIGLRPKTLSDYRAVVDDFVAYCIKEQGDDFKADKRAIEGYLHHRQITPAMHTNPSLRADDKLISPFRLRNIWVALSSVFSWAENSGIRDNPMSGIKPPKLPKTVIEIYEDYEISAGLEYIGSRRSSNNLRDRLIVELYLDTGLRANELLSSTRNHFNLDRNEIFINGKGSKERVVPFGNQTRLDLDAFLSNNPGIKPNDLVFPISQSRAWSMWKEAISKSGYVPRGLHVLRHTFACNFLIGAPDEGIPPGSPLDLMAILGHRDLAMVQHYTQWVSERLALRNYKLQKHSYVDRMAGLFTGSPDLNPPGSNGQELKETPSLVDPGGSILEQPRVFASV